MLVETWFRWGITTTSIDILFRRMEWGMLAVENGKMDAGPCILAIVIYSYEYVRITFCHRNYNGSLTIWLLFILFYLWGHGNHGTILEIGSPVVSSVIFLPSLRPKNISNRRWNKDANTFHCFQENNWCRNKISESKYLKPSFRFSNNWNL